MNNIEKIQQKLPEYDIDAMLVTNPKSRLYASGFISSDGALIVTSSDAWLITDSRYIEAAGAAVKDAKVIPVGRNQKYDDCINEILIKNNVKRLGFEDGKVTYKTYRKWQKRWSGGSDGNPVIEVITAQKLVDTLRNVKSRDELGKMILAQRLAEKVWSEVLPLISTNITEKELAAEIIYRSLRNGADKESFPPIVVSGSNSSRPHGVPGNEKIAKGFLTIDFGVCLKGWCSDTTRTLCIGEPSGEMVKVYNTVLAAQKAGIAAVRSGVRGTDVDAAAREVIEDAGYGEFFGHGFGHSLGLDVHESLSASPLSKDILPAGAVISAEPGIYIPGRFGVRIEDVLFITDDGCENITNITKELTII